MRLGLGAALLGLLAGLGGGAGAETFVPAGGSLYRAPVKSLVALRYEGMVRQTHDLSCGAAALATLLTYFFGEDLDERDVILGIRESVSDEDWAKVERQGFSMLELKRYGVARGYVSEGYELKPGALEKIAHPFIALTAVRGYKHFVVVRGVRDGIVYIADPAYGNRKLRVEAFGGEWENRRILLFMEPQTLEYAETHRAMPASVVARTRSFISHGRVPPARSQEIVSLMDHGLRPLQPSPGSFQ